MLPLRFKRSQVFILLTIEFILCLYIFWCPKDETSRLENLVLKYQSEVLQKDLELKKYKLELNNVVVDPQKTKTRHYIKNLPVIYGITPTYTRIEQKAELVRLSHTLLHVPNFHWIIVEDATSKTELVTNFLKSCGLPYTHLLALTPPNYKLKTTDPNWLKPRGVLQRNAALEWLRTNLDSQSKGVVYFMDDDNTYSLQVFKELRNTNKVSVWPVGLSGALRYESPLVKNGKVTGWFTAWKPDRPFPMDMAGFAINLSLFFKYPDAKFSLKVERGYQESTLLTNMNIKMEDLEPKAKNCNEVIVWHTRTEKTKLKNEDKLKKRDGHGSDLRIEV
ncbi:hypothetical protein LOTGIDRAFT_138821 [Lottia gigantea]|uniref:Galactosylgalactosylxylosylprotein 3-beta-glucuronosyltransferase n=1 Tax=Lottia gigantea TaxID=225164 RepID=V4B895_LOTGI|nr:hypothetical protein LOTGIDRAFT_138821 [Lottia gigantea]ESP01922.1 hypothetical protein LOTGIDRAFT_138821 [Lottia gigantea]